MVPPPVTISCDSLAATSSPLPSNHFLSQPRSAVRPAGVVDTATLNAHDFDVDNRTGFMPFDQPIARLPNEFEAWELLLDDAQNNRLQLGRLPNLTDAQKSASEAWRACVRSMPVLDSTHLHSSEVHLRRAHSVLAWLMHFYIHSQPPPQSHLAQSDVIIPAPLAIPLVSVSSQLQLPVVLTYSDDVLYNWALKNPVPKLLTPPGSSTFAPPSGLPLTPGSAFFSRAPFSPNAPATPFSPAYFTPLSSPLPEEDDAAASVNVPTIDNIRCITLFTGTSDEEEFYLSSARCELAGVAALEAMRATMDELFVGDILARQRITRYLSALASHIDTIAAQLLAVREGCAPDAFYNDIRPWFMGQDSSSAGRKWVFEGVPAHEQPTELSGPSAGQSSLVHALDVFLGVASYSHGAGAGDRSAGPTFLDRMQTYMPRHHRAFLRHLAAAPRPLRALVEEYTESDPALADAYNAAVGAMKRFRDGHMRIVTLYIITPARREREREQELERERLAAEQAKEQTLEQTDKMPLKGTGGTDLVQFLKGVRDRTASAAISH